MRAQRIKRSGIRWIAFSPDDLWCMLISFLVASEMGSYMGKSSDAEVFSGVEPIAAGKRLTKNSSEAREVLADLYILRERTEQREKFPIYIKKNQLVHVRGNGKSSYSRMEFGRIAVSLKLRGKQLYFQSQQCSEEKKRVECLSWTFHEVRVLG